jgi:hypothetical protein
MAADLDIREQLCNDRLTGPAPQISLGAERITQLHAIMFDLDPKLLAPDNPLFRPADDPAAFYANIRPVLDRHPLARSAEVRTSGTGLHAILWLQPAAELRSAADQECWDGLVRVVQSTLPVDPLMPGITAMTRPVGAVNGKNGATVSVLKHGTPVAPEDVEAFAQKLGSAPFRAVAWPLLGQERIYPCPVCRTAGSSLAIDDHVGHCYPRCGRVTTEDLFNLVYRPLPQDDVVDPTTNLVLPKNGGRKRAAGTKTKGAAKTGKQK